MLQRILGSHPDIHTLAEPWLMLHPLYALRTKGYTTEYNELWARDALQNFLETIPGGETNYIEGIRRMYTYLYEKALSSSNKQFFLDKTPRYYFILRDIEEMFPHAKFIWIKRNPLDVALSYKNTWEFSLKKMLEENLNFNSFDFLEGLFSLENFFNLC